MRCSSSGTGVHAGVGQHRGSQTDFHMCGSLCLELGLGFRLVSQKYRSCKEQVFLLPAVVGAHWCEMFSGRKGTTQGEKEDLRTLKPPQAPGS